ncbi:MAG: hypothetical protein IPM81_11135 [Saprospirales bacterium]|nr:hypothetical protein [Saprospirales bacterium]
MRVNKLWITALLALVSWSVTAHVPDYVRKAGKANKVQYRGVCASSESQIDMEINNVRARLLGGGDCWWDFSDGRYIVPKVDVATGQREVSSIFAGSVWLGGIDPAGNLKLACQDYRPSGQNDFWPGPLSEIGITDELTCDNWDRHFRVTGDEIRKHLANLATGDLNPDNIPRGVKGWPARGNPYFADVWGYDLPYTQQALAGFYDADFDGDYDPLKGDFPSIEIRRCPLNRFPDEMVFWIYNDQGGGAPHARTTGKPIQMEVQVQAFSYLTNDELNDMTFQRYKLINRATERIDSTFFAMWVDPDLGCFLDDYIGCDSSKSLMYVYNQDATDGQPNCDCNGVNTYCDKVPILGVDYFRGPLDTFGNEIGMSSFVYYNNPSYGNPAPPTTDPDLPIEFYRYLTGSWRDGTPFTYGGNGYGGMEPTKYALSDPPNDPTGWSMCTANLPFGDRRTLQASGPFTLLPGAVNELIIGIPWVPDIDYPCPDLEGLFRADKLAQGLFDNCFELLDGPDAPTVNWIELNQQVIAILTNDSVSNNFNEQYAQIDFLAPERYRNSPDSLTKDSAKYKFEGYRIYQLANPNVSTADFDDPDKSRPVYQVDIKNGVAAIYNWIETRDPNTNNLIFYPELMVDGGDLGLRHTFPIAEDKFATGNDKRLINHKKYYFAVIAYSYNNFTTFDPLERPVTGQQRPYLPGRKASDGPIKIYTVIPRPIVDQELNASYGDGVVITRFEGAGNNGNFLDLDEASRDALFGGNLPDTVLTYQQGRGPITVTIFNPFEVKDGDYELRFVDGNNTDTKLDKDARWELRRLPDGEIVAADRSIAQLNEQLVLKYGFSVTISQAPLAGSYTWARQKPEAYTDPGETNGALGGEIEFKDPNQIWLTGFPDQEFGLFHYVKTLKLERDAEFDPFQGLSTLGNGWFVPYVLCDWDITDANSRTFTPAWTPVTTNLAASVVCGTQEPTNINSRYFRLSNLPNVDIILTSDTSKWSRCVVIETASLYYTETAGAFPKNDDLRTEGNPATPNKRRVSFDARDAPSVGKKDVDGDGKPDPDGAVDASGKPIYGMGWFPGYAVDVETGRRLNIFFGENSCYSSAIDPAYTGRDMLWNPTNQIVTDNPQEYYDLVLGGQHWVYVSYSTYDKCEALRRRLTPELAPTSNSDIFKVSEMKNIAWAGMLMTAQDFQMRSLREGLIPNDVRIKLRVSKPYTTWYNDDDSNKKSGHPLYQFKIENRQAQALDQVQIENALDSIKVVPNPYYGFSQYETSQFSNVIKITNLPAKCTVTIYSLDGKFIRQYRRDEVYAPYMQIAPDLEWDLKNNKGIPVASGVYLIQVQAPGFGERTIKWFGIARQFDPSGL